MDFLSLGVSPEITNRLKEQGITEPTSIQIEAFPIVMAGKTLRILSKTGTGKTFSYVIPLVQKYLSSDVVTEDPATHRVKILVIIPTRELAFQVASSFETLGFKNKISVVVGGENEAEQIRNWKSASIGIATPGRLLDLLDRRAIDTTNLQTVVFDEADRLIDMGFIDDIRRIYARLPKGLHVVFASATMNLAVDEIAYEFGLELERAGMEADELTAENLIHKIAYVGDQEKFHAVAHYVSEHHESRGIVFSNYRERAHDISKRLKGLGWTAEALSAQLNQDQRNNIIESYRSGKTKVLVASDLASRGLDFLDIDYVINYDLPEDPSIYVHRVGRTARAGRKGEAVSLVGFNDSFQLGKLESFLGAKIEKYEFDTIKLSGPLPRKAREPGQAPAHSSQERPRTQQEPNQDRSHQRRPHEGGRPSGDRRPSPQGNNRGPREPRSGGGYQGSNPRNPNQQQQQRPPQRQEPFKTEAKPSQGAKKSTLWGRLLNFLGLGVTTPKAEERKEGAPRTDASGGRRGHHQSRNRRPRRPHRGHSSHGHSNPRHQSGSRGSPRGDGPRGSDRGDGPRGKD